MFAEGKTLVSIYLHDGRCLEVPEALTTLRRNSELLCVDRQGNVVQRFQTRDVKAYSSDPDAAEMLKEVSAGPRS